MIEVTDYFFGPRVTEQQIEDVMTFDHQVGVEDMALVASVQAGLDSGAVPQGRVMVESEQLIADFHRRASTTLYGRGRISALCGLVECGRERRPGVLGHGRPVRRHEELDGELQQRLERSGDVGAADVVR